MNFSVLFLHMKRKVKTAGVPYPVVVHEDESGGYWVECPSFEGCYSQGKTVEAALKNIREAIELCLECSDERSTAMAVSLHLVTV